ncbi:hypothetical protein NBO_431g0002 [Nosema bombycis CQ1]|uniref:Uncharacterized protein n=1 Tax=Nosema bombycis (strain CQ1 / CVCC 102059) TaxID=578461 RepID=R0KQJ5_NOSB1|nr:hypothetical protein NBO_431g0002 [Nosema bombycis CQ1]|eukprot:EOB12477.1 hypothetical protein NBO_431g0002 [Nosema bombycis CQ1]
MKFEIITLFLIIINTIEDAGLSSNSLKLGERNFENELNQKAFKDLGIALQKETLSDQDQETLKIFGRAIELGKISDYEHREEFKLLGKAIVENTLNDEAKKLLGKLFERGRDEETYAKLRKILVENDKSTTLKQQGPSESQGIRQFQPVTIVI